MLALILIFFGFWFIWIFADFYVGFKKSRASKETLAKTQDELARREIAAAQDTALAQD